jgi:hypothetical protein
MHLIASRFVDVRRQAYWQFSQCRTITRAQRDMCRLIEGKPKVNSCLQAFTLIGPMLIEMAIYQSPC